MGEPTFLEKLRGFIGGCAWRVFLWANRMIDNQYWAGIIIGYLLSLDCTCEVASETEMKWVESCPHHGAGMQRLEKQAYG